MSDTAEELNLSFCLQILTSFAKEIFENPEAVVKSLSKPSTARSQLAQQRLYSLFRNRDIPNDVNQQVIYISAD